MAVPDPHIGGWFRKLSGKLVQVVALDGQDGTVELQHFDGTVEEVDLDYWDRAVFMTAAAPEDWSGSVDISREDFMFDDEDDVGHPAYLTAMDYADRMD